MTLAFFLTHWFEFNYSGQPGEPWYHAATWPNVFVIAITFSAGWVWSKTKFWPLRPLKHILAHVRHHTMLLEEVHHLAHTGKPHPRVQARIDAGEPPTPRRDHA